jgi:hypothetical protein
MKSRTTPQLLVKGIARLRSGGCVVPMIFCKDVSSTDPIPVNIFIPKNQYLPQNEHSKQLLRCVSLRNKHPEHLTILSIAIYYLGPLGCFSIL